MTFVFKPTDKIDVEILMNEKRLTANQELALHLFCKHYEVRPWEADSELSVVTVSDVAIQSVNTVQDIIRNPDKE